MIMLQAQAIKQFSSANIPDPAVTRSLLEQGTIVILKGMFEKELVRQIRRDLQHWRVTGTILNEEMISERRILNGQLLLRHRSTEPSEDFDFRADKTGISAWNYRIGNLHDPELSTIAPKLHENGGLLLKVFQKVYPASTFPHGTSEGRNLYVEFMHFPVSTGYVEEHTHESVADFGLEYNMIGVFSDRGTDYDQGGPVFPGTAKDFRIDDHTESGDVYLFSNRMIHRVEPIRAVHPEAEGRWILTYFWY